MFFIISLKFVKKFRTSASKDFARKTMRDRKKERTVSYWQHVINEVLNKNTVGYQFRFTHFNHVCNNDNSVLNKRNLRRKEVKMYPLGEKFPGVVFTQREAHCAAHFVEGKTIVETAIFLKISPRTVEYYLSMMKRKLNVQTKTDLIHKVIDSHFMKYVDFQT